MFLFSFFPPTKIGKKKLGWIPEHENSKLFNIDKTIELSC